MKPRVPQLLPWLAKKTGIPERRAEALWHEARRWAERHAARDSSACHELAINHWLELISAESLREDAVSFGWRPWARIQTRFWGWMLQTAQKSGVLAAQNWRRAGVLRLNQARN